MILWIFGPISAKSRKLASGKSDVRLEGEENEFQNNKDLLNSFSNWHFHMLNPRRSGR
jgi:hypothetical protein